jgi:hypothetical protein
MLFFQPLDEHRKTEEDTEYLPFHAPPIPSCDRRFTRAMKGNLRQCRLLLLTKVPSRVKFGACRELLWIKVAVLTRACISGGGVRRAWRGCGSM